MTRIARPPRNPQRGAALLTAMVIVTVVASLAAAMVWQQWRSIQVEAAERARAQSYWLLTGALDWARLILREDARVGGADHLSEPWAVPLAEARLSTFLAADTGATDEDDVEAFLSGSIVDLQSRYSLNNVLDPSTGLPAPAEVKTLNRLCELVKAPNGTAEAIVQGLTAAFKSPSVGTGASAADPTAGTMEPLVSVDELRWWGLAPETVQLLAPFVSLLPAGTPVNTNTAPREVLVAVIEGMDQGTAQRVMLARQSKPFNALADLTAVAPNVAATLKPDRVSTQSSYFEVTGKLRLENQVVEERSIVRRSGLDVRTIHRERINSVLEGSAPR